MATPISPTHAALGDAVRAARKAMGMSQEALAAASGMHRNWIGGVERGEQNVTLTSLLRLARVLRTSAAELVAKAEQG